MGMLYRRKKLDSKTGAMIERGPWWVKYYEDGRPIFRSTRTEDKTEARRKLNKWEGQVAEGLHEGPKYERTRFEDLVAGIRQDYAINERKSDRRLEDFIKHLTVYFRQMRAKAITTDHILTYVAKRKDEGAANGSVNRELACLKRMFRLAIRHTPRKVAQIPHIPMLEENNIRSGYFDHEDFLALRGALPDYAKVPVTLTYYSGMRMGEVFSLKWSQVNMTEGKLFLKAQDTKTETPRVLYLTGDLYRVLEAWKRRCEEKWQSCPWICHRGGIQLHNLKHSWRQACVRVGLGKMVEDKAKGREVWQGKIPHDFRRTAIRNMVRAGILESVAMAISGHTTRSVFDRYNITNEADLKAAATRLTEYFEKEKVTLSVTLAELEKRESDPVNAELVETLVEEDGAGERNRTSNQRFTKPLLCH